MTGHGVAAELQERPTEARARWDGEDVLAFDGIYGEYLLGKVAKVFPALRSEVFD